MRLEGMERTMANLRKLPDKVERQVLAQAIEKGGRPMKEAAQKRAPKGMPRRHPKGTPLNRAIVFIKTQAKRGLVEFKLGVDYTRNRVAHLVEFGHRLTRKGKQYGSVRAHPFIRPAYDETKQVVVKNMERLIADGVEREAGKLGRSSR